MPRFLKETPRIKPATSEVLPAFLNGGLAAGLVRFEGDLVRAVRYATVVAGLSTTRAGTAPAMPTLPDVEAHSDFYA